MTDKRYAGSNGLSAVFAQIKAAINEKVTKVSGKDVVNTDVENLLCNEQTDGSYVLTAVVNSGVPTYDWGEGVPGGGSFTDITYEDWLLLTPQEQAAKDYYISNYPSSPLTAGIIGYDNTNSGMNADDVQEAVDELKSDLNEVNSNLTNLTPTLIAASSATGTYGDKLGELASAYNNMSNDQKIKSYMMIGDVRYNISSIGMGVYGSIYFSDVNTCVISVASIMANNIRLKRTLLTSSGISIVDRTTTEDSTIFNLYA